MTTDQLLQLTRELVASPHFSYQPQMRLRNGAIVLDVDALLGVLVYMDPHGLSRVKLHGVDTPDTTVCFPMFLTDDWLPDLEDDGTVGVLRGIVKRCVGRFGTMEFAPGKIEPAQAHQLVTLETKPTQGYYAGCEGENLARVLLATPAP